MQVLEWQNVQVHWREDGDPLGSPLVCVNSLGTDLRMWDDLLPHLLSDTRVIRFDLRGQGGTQIQATAFSLYDLAMDLAGLLDQLGITNCTLVGTSFGGMIAQHLAVTRADLVDRLVLTNTAPKMGNAAMWQARIDAVRKHSLAAIADDILARWFGAAFRTSPKAQFWREVLIRADPDGYIGGCRALAQADLTPMLDQITQRSLVIGGAFDAASPPEQVGDMARQIKNSRFHVLPDVGHLPSIEAPEALATHITAFVNEGHHG